MKALSKPISSPSRADKFPPPLMRFLRSNVNSRSTRGRSRASPMFYLRSNKKTAAGIIETTQEPSSPKVTCIGQVKIRRSNKSRAKRKGSKAKKRRRFKWLKKPIFCGEISSKIRAFDFKRVFSKWVLCFRFGYCKKVDTSEDSVRVYSDNQKGGKIGDFVDSSNVSESGVYKVDEEIKRDFVDTNSSSSSCPPKNALLLTRCRSAPYRSSSLGGRFWGSPLKGAENEVKSEEELEISSCENVVEESTISQRSSKELEKSEELKGIAGFALHPLLLTRCKSEPARTGERLIPEASF